MVDFKLNSHSYAKSRFRHQYYQNHYNGAEVYDIPMADGETAKSGVPYYDSNGNLNKDAEKMLADSKPKSANPFSGLGESIAAIPGRIIKIILALAIFIAFAFIALNVLLCFVEFYLTTALSIILLPFGVNSHTSFISQKH